MFDETTLPVSFLLGFKSLKKYNSSDIETAFSLIIMDAFPLRLIGSNIEKVREYSLIKAIDFLQPKRHQLLAYGFPPMTNEIQVEALIQCRATKMQDCFLLEFATRNDLLKCLLDTLTFEGSSITFEPYLSNSPSSNTRKEYPLNRIVAVKSNWHTTMSSITEKISSLCKIVSVNVGGGCTYIRLKNPIADDVERKLNGCDVDGYAIQIKALSGDAEENFWVLEKEREKKRQESFKRGKVVAKQIVLVKKIGKRGKRLPV